MSNYLERERTERLDHLALAEKALRALLHMHLHDVALRAHAERAMAHVRECQVTITSPDRARSLGQLSRHLDRMNELLAHLDGQAAGPRIQPHV